jgi:transposase-like protein
VNKSHLKEIKMITKRVKGTHYDPVLIERARALGEEIGIARAARVLGISRTVIQSWVRRKRDGRYMSTTDTPEQRELMETKRELQKVRKENEDLKKANIVLKELASVFSKDRSSSSLGWSLNSQNTSKKKD